MPIPAGEKEGHVCLNMVAQLGSSNPAACGGEISVENVPATLSTDAAVSSKVSSRSGQELWSKARQVLQIVQVLERFNTLYGVHSSAIISPQQLEFVEEIGEGRFALVALFRLHSQDYSAPARPVAVKTLKPVVDSFPQEVTRFAQEMNLLRQLQHTCIVEYIGVGSWDASTDETANRTAFLVQEYMNRGSLKDKITLQSASLNSSPEYSDEDALRWAVQITRGIQYMHTRVPIVVHRDLKLANVLVYGGPSSKQQDVKVADFGLYVMLASRKRDRLPEDMRKRMGLASGSLDADARRLAATVEDNLHKPPRRLHDPLHMTGKTGTWIYMAPEVLLGDPYDEKVDVFSFGVVLYELFARRLLTAHLYSEDEVQAYACKVATGFRQTLPQAWPEQLRELIGRCWSQMPEKRPSMTQVRAYQQANILAPAC